MIFNKALVCLDVFLQKNDFMKRLLSFGIMLFFIFSFAQEKEIVKFRGNLSNYNDNNYKTLTVIDIRKNQQIGILPFGENQEMREVVFPTTISNDLEKRYKSSIHEGGQYELVLVLKSYNYQQEILTENLHLEVFNFQDKRL